LFFNTLLGFDYPVFEFAARLPFNAFNQRVPVQHEK